MWRQPPSAVRRSSTGLSISFQASGLRPEDNAACPYINLSVLAVTKMSAEMRYPFNESLV